MKKKTKKQYCDDCDSGGVKRIAIVKCPQCGNKLCKKCMDIQEGLCIICAPSLVDI